jgi:2-keto-4-pentenoate hydratase/2-oxohepta-3-ene-1,7-dioic acid hydratase in catechol pathway
MAQAAAQVEAAEPLTPLQECLASQNLPQVVRMRSAADAVTYARVATQEEGIPTGVIPFATGETPLAEVLDRAVALESHGRVAVWELSAAEAAPRVCSPVALSQAEIDREERFVIGVGLNYKAHADEAGGGDLFLFPKPAAPTPPYGHVAPPKNTPLLDYEVELAFVLLEDIDLTAPPDKDEFLRKVAFFVSNDISDREAILANPGGGFVEAKGQPSFFPAGPWMVRGTELYAAFTQCGVEGLGIRLAVDEGSGFRARQNSMTSLMIASPEEILARLGAWVQEKGRRTTMPVTFGGETRYYPYALDDAAPRLPKRSVFLMGTPDGVALQIPGKLGLISRALIRLRGPFEQFRLEELEQAASGEPGGYLEPGDRVRASIDGLGTQLFTIQGAGSAQPADPCAP